MNQLNDTQAKALALIVGAVMDTVREAGPLGAPAGIMYAAMMTQGCTYNQFVSLMGGLVRLGKLRLSGDCYHIAEEGNRS